MLGLTRTLGTLSVQIRSARSATEHPTASILAAHRVPGLLVAGLLLAWVIPAAAAPAPLQAEERRQLSHGDVLLLSALPPGVAPKGSQGGIAVALVHAPAEAVWQLLLDYPNHVGLYPGVASAQVLESNATHALVRYGIALGPLSFHFFIRYELDTPGRRIVWQLARDRPNSLFRDNWGYWQVEPHGHDVLLIYAMACRTSLPTFLTRASSVMG